MKQLFLAAVLFSVCVAGFAQADVRAKIDTAIAQAESLSVAGKHDLAYKQASEAYKLAKSISGISAETIASIDSDLGTYAFRKGDISLGMSHHRKAIAVFLNSKTPDYESLYTAANNMGGQMWFASKLDSSIYFFDIALEALSKTERTPLNQYYRPAVIQNNVSGVYSVQGQAKKAIDAMKACIENLRTYLAVPEDKPKRATAITFQFEAIDNLGGIYKELGDYAQALSLEYYSYQQKLKHPDADPTGIFKSEILLGQVYLAMKDHDQALQYLTKGLENIAKAGGDLVWQGDAAYYLGVLHEEKNNAALAAQYYERADSLYEATLQGEYDNIYLQFLRDVSLFYADNGRLPLALSKANKGFNYVKKTQGAETLTAFYQILNLAQLYLKTGEYKQSLVYSKQALDVVDKLIKTSSHQLDSVKTEMKKPKAILLKVKAAYQLMPQKDTATLSAMLKELNSAISIIERRKTIIRDAKDIGLLMEDHMELLSFIKQLTLDLYRLTNNQAYIDHLMNLQEAGTYSRIRSRLDKMDSVRFAHVPAQVQEKEKQLKAAISNSLQQNDAPTSNMHNYFTAVEEWNEFQQTLKKQYPQYYNMRYESIFSSLGDLQKSAPAATTLVRYFFIDKDLFAVVLDAKTKQLVPLSAAGIDNDIKTIADYSSRDTAVIACLYRLHKQLWEPLAPHIRNTKLMIIPDGILFNLSFETLTPKKITNLDQLAAECLLSKYSFSYHYSLTLAGDRSNAAAMKNNFVAFAPGFFDEQKKNYIATVKDSFQLDQTYVTLLPQPSTVSFASKAKNLFNGNAYLNNSSTAAAFRDHAGGNQIIHIGTHAESNNLSPEFSRLIFSKQNASEQNSVYLHELYNCDLRSELAVLTACESGKPGYQDGEGMISLAHAFNYAGSESMVTGLWKIDETASTMLIEAFYKNLLQGMDKDEALRQAKLHYLKNSKGRMLAPQYWAGLVLMGDTSPVTIEKQNTITWWLAGGGLLLIAAFLVLKRRRA
jgi:CHAT domain-containing protein/tetratricopeptide (TPR) repeat protein